MTRLALVRTSTSRGEEQAPMTYASTCSRHRVSYARRTEAVPIIALLFLILRRTTCRTRHIRTQNRGRVHNPAIKHGKRCDDRELVCDYHYPREDRARLLVRWHNVAQGPSSGKLERQHDTGASQRWTKACVLKGTGYKDRGAPGFHQLPTYLQHIDTTQILQTISLACPRQ